MRQKPPFRRAGLCSEKDPKTFTSIDEIIEAWKNQFRYLVKQGVISLVTAQEIHRESGHRPFMSACNEYCLKNGKDLVDGGAKYSIGPVFTGRRPVCNRQLSGSYQEARL